MTVGWDDGLTWPGLPALPGDVAADACVVGLGGSGLAAVEELTARGLDVVGVDAGRVAAGAAGRNGGFLLGGAAPFLHDALAAWGPCALDLYRATLDEITRLRELLGDEVIRPVGSIRLAGLPGEPSADELADVRAHAAALREHGIAVEDYDGPLGRGIFLPDDAAMNPALRAFGLARRAAARLFEQTPVREVAPGRVITGHGTVTCATVVVAVDGRLEVLMPQLAGRVRTARLQMLATAPQPPVVPCPVYGRWGYDYAQQLPDGRLFAGGGRDRVVDAEWTTDASPTAPVQDWIEHVARSVAGGSVEVTHRWAASVGFTGDGRPLCTLADRDVVAVGGYSGTGNLVGPVAARAAVALVLDGTPPPAWASA